jgi:hypothetical protein
MRFNIEQSRICHRQFFWENGSSLMIFQHY